MSNEGAYDLETAGYREAESKKQEGAHGRGGHVKDMCQTMWMLSRGNNGLG
jgi:hypothetical protein